MALIRVNSKTKFYFCSKCKIFIPDKVRNARENGRGYLCPVCQTGLYRKAAFIIRETPDLEDVLLGTAKVDAMCF